MVTITDREYWVEVRGFLPGHKYCPMSDADCRTIDHARRCFRCQWTAGFPTAIRTQKAVMKFHKEGDDRFWSGIVDAADIRQLLNWFDIEFDYERDAFVPDDPDADDIVSDQLRLAL